MENKIILDNGLEFRGGAFERVDNRDFKFEEFAQSSGEFDWNKGVDVMARVKTKLNNPNFVLPVKNQGSSSSCGGQAGSYYERVLEALQTGVYTDGSAKFIYAQGYVDGGGMYFNDLCSIVKKQGCPKSALLPDGTTEEWMTKSQDITDDIRAQAKFSRAQSYAKVNKITIDDVAKAIDAGNGAVLIVYGSNNGTWRKEYPTAPASADKATWGHFIYATKAYKNGYGKVIEFVNSWGDTVGVKGRQKLNEAYFKSGCVIACRTMIQVADTIGWCADKWLSNGVATANLNLRETAGLDGKIIAKIASGSRVEVLGFANQKDGYNWVKVQVLNN